MQNATPPRMYCSVTPFSTIFASLQCSYQFVGHTPKAKFAVNNPGNSGPPVTFVQGGALRRGSEEGATHTPETATKTIAREGGLSPLVRPSDMRRRKGSPAACIGAIAFLR